MSLRCYVFVHAGLSPVYQAVQSAHAVAELVAKQDETVLEWAANHKTLLLMDGGNSKKLQEYWNIVSENTFSHRRAFFMEDEDTLQGIHTAFAVVVDTREFSSPDDKLYLMLNSAKLLRA